MSHINERGYLIRGPHRITNHEPFLAPLQPRPHSVVRRRLGGAFAALVILVAVWWLVSIAIDGLAGK